MVEGKKTLFFFFWECSGLEICGRQGINKGQVVFGRDVVAEVSACLSILTTADRYRYCGKTERREKDGIAVYI